MPKGHAYLKDQLGRAALSIVTNVAEGAGEFAERETALAMLDDNKVKRGPATVAADKGFDTHDFVAECRSINVVPHIAQNITAYRGSAIDARTTRHAGYSIVRIARLLPATT